MLSCMTKPVAHVKCIEPYHSRGDWPGGSMTANKAKVMAYAHFTDRQQLIALGHSTHLRSVHAEPLANTSAKPRQN